MTTTDPAIVEAVQRDAAPDRLDPAADLATIGRWGLLPLAAGPWSHTWLVP